MARRKSPAEISSATALEYQKIEAGKAVALGIVGLIGKLGWPLAAFLSVRELAGRQTDANLLLALLSDVTGADRTALMLSWAVTIVSGGFAYHWRALYLAKIEQIGSLRAAYERSVDPSRSSSGLAPTGETPSEVTP